MKCGHGCRDDGVRRLRCCKYWKEGVIRKDLDRSSAQGRGVQQEIQTCGGKYGEGGEGRGVLDGGSVGGRGTGRMAGAGSGRLTGQLTGAGGGGLNKIPGGEGRRTGPLAGVGGGGSVAAQVDGWGVGTGCMVGAGGGRAGGGCVGHLEEGVLGQGFWPVLPAAEAPQRR